MSHISTTSGLLICLLLIGVNRADRRLRPAAAPVGNSHSSSSLSFFSRQGKREVCVLLSKEDRDPEEVRVMEAPGTTGWPFFPPSIMDKKERNNKGLSVTTASNNNKHNQQKN